MSDKTSNYIRVGSIITGVLLAVTFVVLAITWLFFMHSEVVEPGHELVVNDKPYLLALSPERVGAL